MKRLLFIGLLVASVALSGCGKRGPDGSHIYGPEERHITPNGDFLLVYRVAAFKPQYPDIQYYLQGLAQEAIEDHGMTGWYRVAFVDKTIDRQLITFRFQVTGDLLFANRVELLEVSR